MSFATEQHSSPVKLYLVDHHLAVRQAFAEAFKIRGKYSVVGHAGNSSELLDQNRAFTADVIVLDFSLPKASCLDTLHQLRKMGVDTPVLILSGDPSGGCARAAMQAGANGFVSKQSDFSEMERAIDAVAHGETYISKEIKESFEANGNGDAHSSPTSTVLSNREREIMVLLANGKPNREIGKLLAISVRTVDTHRSNILKKLGFKTNAELVKLAIAEGWVTT
jgi:DNA-binding NarL/FixJ family response regulator